ncbi:hypothetical protein [Novosphingobium cyanobacteriorum]|uniref:Uncharacterized protein n=1 Tax=Novosphingobium cyanobacteriorum TaxID=3024215 RepID=A0ABT6CEN9_9SPHN|nr:hypothetical protein [Novosphingobium cyanobacteriorum]MDF8332392.1 hypothetical protein [Novosphingobium cyanobacteriorum]
MAAPAIAPAQSASTYQLPPASPTPTPRAAGPVDDGAPAPVATASPTPTIVIPTPTVAPSASPRPRATRAPAPVPTPPSATPAATPSPTLPAAAPTLAAPSVPPEPVAAPSAETPPPAATPLAPPTDTNWLPYAAIGAVLALIVFGIWAWLRRRREARDLPEPAPIPVVPAVPREKPEPAAQRAPEPTAPPPAPQPAPQPLPAPAFRPAPTDPLVFTLEATRLSATLVAATLAYRLVASNHGAAPLSDIAISGDMTSAHASRPTDELFALTGPELPPLHSIDSLAPGESITLGGEIRLPLSAILPIRHGEAQLFVPLARFDGWASATGGGAVHTRSVFLIGQEGDAGDRLQPFRIDLGPRVWSPVGQKALPVPVT